MTLVSPTPSATGQLSRPAGIAALALATLVAIAVAGLFLVLIGAKRSDGVAAPEHYRAPSGVLSDNNNTAKGEKKQ